MSVAGRGFSRGGGRDPRPVGGRCRRKGTEELSYHVPVMAVEVVAGLLVDDDGLYIDATAGGGGHSEVILQALGSSGNLLACDRDSAAMNEAGRRLAPHRGRVTFLQCAFSSLARSAAPLLRQFAKAQPSWSAASGVLFDLGVSSHQIDESKRGFSYHRDGPLDMRMDRSAGVPAGWLLAQILEADLVNRDAKERGYLRALENMIVGGLLSPELLGDSLESIIAQIATLTKESYVDRHSWVAWWNTNGDRLILSASGNRLIIRQ